MSAPRERVLLERKLRLALDVPLVVVEDRVMVVPEMFVMKAPAGIP